MDSISTDSVLFGVSSVSILVETNETKTRLS